MKAEAGTHHQQKTVAGTNSEIPWTSGINLHSWMLMNQAVLQNLQSPISDEAAAASRALNSELALLDFDEAGCAAILLQSS